MRTRSTLRKKDCGRLLRPEEMVAQLPGAAGGSGVPIVVEHGYSGSATGSSHADERQTTSLTRQRRLLYTANTSPQGKRDTERRLRSLMKQDTGRADAHPLSSPLTHTRNYSEELADLVIDVCSERSVGGYTGEELAEAFRDASGFPPVTQQSLGELDIENIMTNIRLRHDVNFDKDLSFRPNVDGAKGQEKARTGKKYWAALIAELVLYERLYHGSPQLHWQEKGSWEEIIHHAQRRLPALFQTIRHVMKSLVPDRDHSRVDELFDVPMLMQGIQRGICDLVRLAESVAILLKEHCAPMRDEWVDAMVASISLVRSENSQEHIVRGLRELLGILEAMKLVRL